MLNNFAARMEAVMKEACSALTRAADDMAQFNDAHQKEAPLYAIRDKVLAQWMKHCHNPSDEEIRSQMAWSKPNQQDHIMKHIPAQTTIIICLSPPCILSHPTDALQCGYYF